MGSGNKRPAKLILYAGIASILVELFSIYYVVPSARNPMLSTHPVLNYLGASEGLIGAALVVSAIVIGIGLMILGSKNAFSASYLAGFSMLVAGIALTAYGFSHTIPVSTAVGNLYVEPYVTRGVLTAFLGFWMLVFTAVFRYAGRKESVRRSGMDNTGN